MIAMTRAQQAAAFAPPPPETPQQHANRLLAEHQAASRWLIRNQPKEQ